MAFSEVYIPVDIGDGLECAFFRLKELGPQVLFKIKFVGEPKRNFDKHRLAVIWFDNEVANDFCSTKHVNDIMSNLNPNNRPMFVFENTELSGVVWHGLVSEGTGIIGKLLKTEKVVLRVYYENYTVHDAQMAAPQLAALKQNVMSKILGI